jgi:hypothetical protein
MKRSLKLPFPIKAILLVFALCSLSCPVRANGALPHVNRKTLDQPTEIQGYPCAKGFAWFFDDGRLNRCTVTREIAFGEARIPAGSYIGLHPDGTPDIVQMSHDAPILGMTCWAAVGWVRAKARWWPFIPAASSSSVTWRETRRCREFPA